MARIRTIKPEFWTDGDILKLSRDTRLFYIGLWNFADDNGVLDYDLIGLKAKIFPNDRIKIEKLTQELQKIGKILIYEVDKKPYLFVKNLTNHQVIDRKRKSNLPLPDDSQLKSLEISPIRKEGKEGKETLNGHLSDEDFLKTLKSNPAYKHIDIDNELAKMDAWLLTHKGRQKTRRFIVNWLNRIDKSLEIKPSIIKEEKRPEPVDPRERAKVSALIHKTVIEMKAKK